jgi:hypothetical protein
MLGVFNIIPNFLGSIFNIIITIIVILLIYNYFFPSNINQSRVVTNPDEIWRRIWGNMGRREVERF